MFCKHDAICGSFEVAGVQNLLAKPNLIASVSSLQTTKVKYVGYIKEWMIWHVTYHNQSLYPFQGSA